MTKLYTIAAVFIGLFMMVAQGLQPPHPAAAESGVGPQPAMGRVIYATPQVEAGTDDVVLERGDNGHFFADVTINGTPINMVVDTGASIIALTRDDARRAGIATTIGMSEAIGEGAGGTVYGDETTIDRVALGPVEAENVQAVVLGGGQMSLLGQSFLRQFASVEIHGDQMVLRK